MFRYCTTTSAREECGEQKNEAPIHVIQSANSIPQRVTTTEQSTLIYQYPIATAVLLVLDSNSTCCLTAHRDRPLSPT